MEYLNLSELDGEIIEIICKSTCNFSGLYCDGEYSYIEYNSRRLPIPHDDLKKSNIKYLCKYYSVCIYKGEYYKISYGNIIKNILSIPIAIPTSSDSVKTVKLLVSCEKVESPFHFSLFNYENSKIIGTGDVSSEEYIKKVITQPDLSFYRPNVDVWYKSENIYKSLVESGVEMPIRMVRYHRDSNIDKILK